MSYRFIAVEGNIGAGKTTLSRMIAQHYNSRLILEEFVDNNFLPKFYNNPERFAFPLELSFLADRYKQLKNLINNQDLFHDKIVIGTNRTHNISEIKEIIFIFTEKLD